MRLARPCRDQTTIASIANHPDPVSGALRIKLGNLVQKTQFQQSGANESQVFRQDGRIDA